MQDEQSSQARSLPRQEAVSESALTWYERPSIPHILIAEDQGRRALIVDGAVHSVAAEHGHLGSGYWAAMIPDERPRHALLLGLGGGTVVQLLTRRFGPVPIIAVEDDPEIVEVARREFSLDVDNLQIELVDAFAYVAAARRRFDLILVDLYRGNQPVRGTLGRPFLQALKRLLLPRGQIVVNCFSVSLTPERLRRIESVFRSVTIVPAGSNRVLFCRV